MGFCLCVFNVCNECPENSYSLLIYAQKVLGLHLNAVCTALLSSSGRLIAGLRNTCQVLCSRFLWCVQSQFATKLLAGLEVNSLEKQTGCGATRRKSVLKLWDSIFSAWQSHIQSSDTYRLLSLLLPIKTECGVYPLHRFPSFTRLSPFLTRCTSLPFLHRRNRLEFLREGGFTIKTEANFTILLLKISSTQLFWLYRTPLIIWPQFAHHLLNIKNLFSVGPF